MKNIRLRAAAQVDRRSSAIGASGQTDFFVDCDFVGAHLGLDLVAVGIEDDLIRLLQRHMASSTTIQYLSAQGRKLPAILHLVAADATRRKGVRVALRLVDIVAGTARHRGGTIAAATH